MIGFGQGYASMSPACKQLEKFALERKFVTDCPILRWCINNVVIMKDPAENIKFDKSKVKYRIDGAVALAMAIGMYIPDLTKEYAYSKRGIRDL
jgi:phage terminase large subunit-like protein